MQPSVHNTYLETDVLTASPQKRQLLALDAILRNIETGRQLWQAGEDGEACERLIRAQQILTELMAGLNHDIAPQLSKQVAALYVFAFQRLIDANLSHDLEKLDEAFRVIEPLRDAWRDVCAETNGTTRPCVEAAEAPASDEPATEPLLPEEACSGFSLEA